MCFLLAHEEYFLRGKPRIAEAYTLVSDQRPYRTGKLPCRVEALEVAREVVGLVTYIPLYPELEEEEIEHIVAALQRFTADP